MYIYFIFLDSCLGALGVRRKSSFKDTPDVENSEELKAQAEKRINIIKDNGKGFLNSLEVFYNVSIPSNEERTCEDAVKGW